MATYTDQSSATTIFSDANATKRIYPGHPSRWTVARVTLQTAGGAVAVGYSAELLPALSGKGRLMIVNQEAKFTIPPGQLLYVGADSVQRLAVQLEPLPWLQQIVMTLGSFVQSLGGKAAADAPPTTMKPPNSGKTGIAQTWDQLKNIGKRPPPKR